jgi:uroporphyrinogen decarboxylase
MLLGDERANQINAAQCLDVAGDAGGFILAPGCDIPFATPPANIAAAGAVARDPYVRDIARHLAAVPAELSIAKVDLSGHVVPDKLKIDIVTLDSLGCAPCQYMVAAARSAAERYGDAVAIAEHKIKVRDGLAMMAALGVRNIPTLCMDGEIVFVSAIPSHKALAEAIEERLRAKGLR